MTQSVLCVSENRKDSLKTSIHDIKIELCSAKVIKVNRSRDRIYENRLFEIIVPELRYVVSKITHWKPDIVILNAIRGK